MAEFTPMMQQYLKTKEEYKDVILFYRLGDFYEMFFDDAKTVSRELDLVLTGKDCGQEERAPMCGVPFHSADSYIARLIEKGYKVAICEQVEDPKLAKGLVKREVIRMITPGTIIENTMLDENTNNYIAAVLLEDGKAGIAFTDISTGECYVTAVEKDVRDGLENEITRFSPKEILLDPEALADNGLCVFLKEKMHILVTPTEPAIWREENVRATLSRQFENAMLDEQGIRSDRLSGRALGALTAYLIETQKTDLSHIRKVQYYEKDQFMEIDLTARRNLELFETIRDHDKKGSLLGIVDKTKTSMGSRLLRSFMEKPLLDIMRIRKRQMAVDAFYADRVVRDDTQEVLRQINDVERLIARVVYGTANARELRAIGKTASYLPVLKNIIKSASNETLGELESMIDPLDDVRAWIDESIVEDPPFSVREGNMIRTGFDPEIDRCRELLSGGQNMLAKIESAEREKTGIPKLRIGYNKVFGYYIEVTNSYLDMVPETYIRKQTLTNAERFITEELKDLEGQVLTARERMVSLEYDRFCEVRERIAAQSARIQKTAHAIALLDVFSALAETGETYGYVMPEVDLGDLIDIRDGRHPVVERMLKDTVFVPNDTKLDCKEDRAAIITGPNMAGKSTYMRQTALVVLRAQMGSMVPARSAHTGICDRIFTRIGASDDLSSGQSTFMVEMSEVAGILKHATSRSLLILDEIGRGTSTFDGMAIARAVLEYVANPKKLGARTMFATHYHQLTELEGLIGGVKNYNIAAKKRGDEIVFLRKIVRGGTDDSYGVEVAKLAGVPETVIRRAKDVLAELESTAPSPAPLTAGREESDQISLGNLAGQALIDELIRMDVNTLTPIEAMNTLFQIVKKAKEME